MKKIKLLSILTTIVSTSAAVLPLVACNKKQETVEDIEVIGSKSKDASTEGKATYQFKLPSTPATRVYAELVTNTNIQLEQELVTASNNIAEFTVLSHDINELGTKNFSLDIYYAIEDGHAKQFSVKDLSINFKTVGEIKLLSEKEQTADSEGKVTYTFKLPSTAKDKVTFALETTDPHIKLESSEVEPTDDEVSVSVIGQNIYSAFEAPFNLNVSYKNLGDIEVKQSFTGMKVIFAEALDVNPIGEKQQTADDLGKATYKFQLPSTPKADVALSLKTTSSFIKLESERVTATNNIVEVTVVGVNIIKACEANFNLSFYYTTATEKVVDRNVTDLKITFKEAIDVAVVGNKTQKIDDQGIATYKFILPSTPSTMTPSVTLQLVTTDPTISLVNTTVTADENNQITVEVKEDGTSQEDMIKFGLKISYKRMVEGVEQDVEKQVDDLIVAINIIFATRIEISGTTATATDENCSYTAKIYPENASYKDVYWTVSYPEGSTAKATVTALDGTVRFSEPGDVILTATALDGSYVSSSFNITCLTDKDAIAKSEYRFQRDSWEEVCEYADKGYDALLDHYYGLKKKASDPFIGLIREFKINGKSYNARVIGEEHDDLADGTGKAALTFELKEVYSDSDGSVVESAWYKLPQATTKHPMDYLNSTLRHNLTGKGTATEGLWGKNILKAIEDTNPIIYPHLKEVTKTIAVGERDGESTSYHLTTYTDKLFSKTVAECYGHALQSSMVEGKQYRYYQLHHSAKDFGKDDLRRYFTDYWLASPAQYVGGKYARAVSIKNYGFKAEALSKPITYGYGVDVVFCI